MNPLPEIAPIIAHVITATTPMPPFIFPTIISEQLSRFSAIPLEPIIVPARINSGLAIRIGLIIWLNPHNIILFIDTSPNMAMNASAPPKQYGIGTLSINKTTSNITSISTSVNI